MAIKGGQRGGRKEPAHRLNELITDISRQPDSFN